MKEDIDMLENVIPNKVIKLIIDTLSSDPISPEEQQLGCFICNKLQILILSISG